MKKTLSILAALFMLASCSKPADQLEGFTRQVPKTQYFSQVKRYTDSRAPKVDTVWTLQLFSQTMVDTYKPLDGYIYETHSTFTTVGVFYSK